MSVPNAAHRTWLLSCHVNRSRGRSGTTVPGWATLPPIGWSCPPRNRMRLQSYHRLGVASGVAFLKTPGTGACGTRGISVHPPRGRLEEPLTGRGEERPQRGHLLAQRRYVVGWGRRQGGGLNQRGRLPAG